MLIRRSDQEFEEYIQKSEKYKQEVDSLNVVLEEWDEQKIKNIIDSWKSNKELCKFVNIEAEIIGAIGSLTNYYKSIPPHIRIANSLEIKILKKIRFLLDLL